MDNVSKIKAEIIRLKDVAQENIKCNEDNLYNRHVWRQQESVCVQLLEFIEKLPDDLPLVRHPTTQDEMNRLKKFVKKL